jgi:hypothetical protein
MKKALATSLAEQHARFNIFRTEVFDVKKKENIVHRLKGIPELGYLCKFYKDYVREYRRYESEQRRGGVGKSRRRAGKARSTDLPFIGEEALKSGQARYMFVFEGSLCEPTRLTTTVLSCLWPVESFGQIQSIFCTFWPTTYFNILEGLGMTPEIAKQAYVVDAIRTGDLTKDRDLLRDEITLLKPDLVVLVGGKAEHRVDPKVRNAEPKRFLRVNFPNNARDEGRIGEDEKKFEELHRRLRKLEP